ncbi:MAG: cytochrome P450 [Alphaproteobacteria bacterium]|nr:cytochrome P450 [Alphaproteobacteria bacterium]MBL6940337.1 cytochrome P450 [Alphaproteobacteria bacterium]MBL7098205.1 cytochrome P450 [Alphaproteobacteria bacterium]
MTDAALDNALADPAVFADDAQIYGMLRNLRREDPVHWTQPDGFRPFWAITKHADILEIEKLNDQFHNEPRSVLMNMEAEKNFAAMWGGPDPKTGRVSPLRTLIDMDGEDHRAYRGLTQSWFMPVNLRKGLEARTVELARRYVDRMMELGPECDFAKEIAVYYPLHVIMSIMGVPESDEPKMLQLTQELFGGGDPDMQRKERDPNTNVIAEFFMYFNAMTAARRANPGEDLATVIANGKVNGEPLGPVETASYYIIVATAGHDTTSSCIAGGLKALLEHPDQLEKLKANPDLLNNAVDEIIRWVTPVQHFMRTNVGEPYTLRGRTIEKGQALMLYYMSGNRDEEVYADADKFRVDRDNNRHVSFGYGAHVCLGQHLAKMEIRAFFKELLGRLDSIELTGPTSRVKSTFVSGLKTLPVRYRIRPGA